MQMTQKGISSVARDEAAFAEGRELHRQRRVSVRQTDSFWKNEVYITAAVTEANGAVYHVRIFWKGEAAGGCRCDCQPTDQTELLCRHGVAAAFAYLEQKENQERKPVATAPWVRTMLEEYLDREKAGILAADNSGPLTLMICIGLNRGQVTVSWRVGVERSYMVRDLEAFVRAVKTGACLEYTKNVGFYHGLEGFTPESRPLVRLLCEMVEEEAVRREAFYPGLRESRRNVLRELPLCGIHMDTLFSLLLDRVVEVKTGDGTCRTVTIKAADPELTVRMCTMGGGGAAVWLEGRPEVFGSDRQIYVLTGTGLFCCGEIYSRDMRFFLDALLNQAQPGRQTYVAVAEQTGDREEGDAASRTVGYSVVGKRDLPVFLAQVLPLVKRHCILYLQDEGERLKSLVPDVLEAYFYLDSPVPDVITLSVNYRYGTCCFSPLSESHPQVLYRDELRELKIGRILKRYFADRYLKTDLLVIDGDVDRIYRLMSGGLAELEAEGTVELSHEAQTMAVHPIPPVQVNLTLNKEWLRLDIDLEGVEPEELKDILHRYDRKQTYYRRKDGSFLSMEQDTLRTLWDLYAAAEKEEDGSFVVPSGRLWYVSRLLERDRGIRRFQDGYVDRLLKAMEIGRSEECGVPAPLENVLRPYQKKGFLWLLSLDRLGFGGILADDMGLGKTIQVLALLLEEKQHPHGAYGPSLVVCPSSLVLNWERECQKFAPSLKVMPVMGDRGQRELCLRQTGDCDLVITSYDLLKRDIRLYESLRFRYQIIDEAQYIKNKKTRCARAVKSVCAITRFALTGTPVENRLEELWSIFDYLMPGYLFSYRRFKTLFEMPLAKENSENGRILDRLLLLIRPFVLRRMKKEVLTELPDKVENVVYAGLEGEQKKLYTAGALQLKEMLEGSGTRYAENRFQVLAQLTRLRQICCDPGLCYEDYEGGSAKLSACLELVKNAVAGRHYILVFSQFASMLQKIRAGLEQINVSSYLLTGCSTAAERKRMTDDFGRTDTPVFLISLKAGGVGLNLAAADVVIHYDPWWNLAAQNQATDRAHRIGQKHTVMVYRIIARHTIEENIMKLQTAKQNLVSQVVDAPVPAFALLSREELIAMLDDVQEGQGTP